MTRTGWLYIYEIRDGIFLSLREKKTYYKTQERAENVIRRFDKFWNDLNEQEDLSENSTYIEVKI